MTVEGLQQTLFAPESSWTPPSLSSLPTDWGSRVSIDLETCDPHLKQLGPGPRRPGGFIAGVALGFGHRSVYLPVRHAGGGNLDEDQVKNYLRDMSKTFKGEIVGANLSYDKDWIETDWGIHFRPRRWYDVQVAEALLDELQFSYSLENIAKRRGIPGKDEVTLRSAAHAFGVDPKGGMWKLHSKYVGIYGEQDAALPLEILSAQEREIAEQEIQGIWDLESRLLPCLVTMRQFGVRIDTDKLEQIEKWSREEEQKQLDYIFNETRVRVGVEDVNGKKEWVKVLNAIGVYPDTTATGQPKIDKNLFKQLNCPVGEAIQRAKKVNKLRNTFAASIRRHMVNGRIHCTFRQIVGEGKGGSDEAEGAKFGRMSCVDPNLQQQPSRDDFANFWRSIYVPEEGKQWACLDYSQQEPRMAVHFAELAGCPRADEMGNRYRKNPKADNHTMMAQIVYDQPEDWQPKKKQRTQCKDLYLAKSYGMGDAKLCRELGLDTTWILTRSGRYVEVAGPEGQAIIDKFDQKLPFVKELAERCEKVARRRGFLRTLLGRRCRFPLDESGLGYDFTHKALNRLIQGSSADQTKKATVDVFEAGYVPQLQVHDELDASVEHRQEAEDIAEIMRHCVKLTVPARVDVEVGPSWGEIE